MELLTEMKEEGSEDDIDVTFQLEIYRCISNWWISGRQTYLINDHPGYEDIREFCYWKVKTSSNENVARWYLEQSTSCSLYIHAIRWRTRQGWYVKYLEATGCRRIVITWAIRKTLWTWSYGFTYNCTSSKILKLDKDKFLPLKLSELKQQLQIWLKDLGDTGHSETRKQVIAVLEELLNVMEFPSNDIQTSRRTTKYYKNTVAIIWLKYIMKENGTIIHSLTEHVWFLYTLRTLSNTLSYTIIHLFHTPIIHFYNTLSYTFIYTIIHFHTLLYTFIHFFDTLSYTFIHFHTLACPCWSTHIHARGHLYYLWWPLRSFWGRFEDF